nr:PH domain-containing protein [Allomuricauda sp.]
MKSYPSKISYPLLATILAILIGCAVPMMFPPIWPGLVVSLLVMAFVLHVFTTMRYTCKDGVLIIKWSFFTYQRIDILSITSITGTNSLISSPAASLDRLEIRFKKHQSVLVSPKDKEGFIAHLSQINPDIEVKL